MLYFMCAETKICSTFKKSQNLMNMIVCKIFMSLLKALIVKNSHILAEIYFIFLKHCPRPNSIANLNLNERIGKVVIKFDKF